MPRQIASHSLQWPPPRLSPFNSLQVVISEAAAVDAPPSSRTSVVAATLGREAFAAQGLDAEEFGEWLISPAPLRDALMVRVPGAAGNP